MSHTVEREAFVRTLPLCCFRTMIDKDKTAEERQFAMDVQKIYDDVVRRAAVDTFDEPPHRARLWECGRSPFVGLLPTAAYTNPQNQSNNTD